ncbi:hypothetical protein BLS_006067 [Venturia inaequalis]|uniref:Fungal lipase-type domain-containing protein n=1 Tax=Venturia inaequalis TaxID=5025 RepID=A0A8H3YSR7_VENIN|nr:hypothetical protein BLS_006067 [Venturia inaequalis]
MTFWTFGNTHGKKRKERLKPSLRPATTNGVGHGGSNYSVSTVNLSRPSQELQPAQQYYPQPPSRPWNGSQGNSYGNPHAIVSRPNVTMRPPHTPPYGPESYGPPLVQAIQWSSPPNPPNAVYMNHNQSSTQQSLLHIPSAVTGGLQKASKSVTNLNPRCLTQGAALYDRMSSKLDAVITCMDEEKFSGDETDLRLVESHEVYRDGSRNVSQTLSVPGSNSSNSTNHFSKVWSYSNSRLPPYLPPLKVYMPTYPLLCLASQYSLRAYDKPKKSEREHHVKASVFHGTKAMVIKSMPVDDMNTIVFAVRGTQTFMDWTVNFAQAPCSPTDFLDDVGNLCHSGFLCVARFMIAPVAARLRELLQKDPSRSAASLLITGHSAGGAVAQLLYAHMLSETVSSELTHLTGFFKRVHCVTFGAPPVTLLPLQKPTARRHHKSLFFAFANEGDPVVRADRAIVRSLLKLYVTPTPDAPCAIMTSAIPGVLKCKKSRLKLAAQASSMQTSNPAPMWAIPSSTLSLGGRIVLLRERYGSQHPDDIEACQVSDEMLRQVVYGDPLCHTMTLYAKRIEMLATRAVTVTGFS